MSWHQWRTTRFAVLACGLLAAACDDNLGFGDDGDDDSDETAEENRHTSGSTSSGGGAWGGTSTATGWVVDEHGQDGTDDDHDGRFDEADDDGDDYNVDHGDNPLVTVEQGTLEGRWADGNVRRFLGVPYAAAPTGDLRWAAPEPAKDWSKTRQADVFGPACPQTSSKIFPNDASYDEDCLYLNVWTPGSAPKHSLPVLVFIHGGDHAHGSAAQPVPGDENYAYYDGTGFARRNVVVVTVNYRLGVFGFLSHPSLDDDDLPPGNAGLLDQQFALKWIQDNIAKFGGDPGQVTLIGQGSGASDVCMHVVAPSSQGLFQQAISESGGCALYQPTAKDVSKETDIWLGKVGCGDASDALGCLRKKSTKDLINASVPSPTPFTAIVDGSFLKKQPRVLFKARDYDNVPYVIGSNSDEGVWWNPDFAYVKSEADYHAYLQKTFPGASLQELCEIYPHDQYGATPEAYRRQLAYLLGDAYVTCAVSYTALLADDGDQPVYLYNFDVRTDSEDPGPSYGGELGYVFGTGKSLSASQRKVSDLVQTYWTNVARYGDPNADDVLEWPAFTSKNDLRMNFNLESEAVKNYHDKECVFWHKYFDGEFGDYDLK
jgi:para-nitrobenzyl esterase